MGERRTMANQDDLRTKCEIQSGVCGLVEGAWAVDAGST
jgi:hypothetical protein